VAIILTPFDDNYSEKLAQPEEIRALAGNDTVSIYAVDHVAIALYGGGGNDILQVDNGGGDTKVFGDEGDDRITIDGYPGGEAHGGAGNDRIDVIDEASAFGDDGNDTIMAGYVSSVDGGPGDDVLGGFDVYGGAGADTILYGTWAYGEGGDDVIDSESASGGPGDDRIEGDFGQGGDGHDLMRSGETNSGGAGHDVFFPFLNILPDEGGDPAAYIMSSIQDFVHAEDRIATPIPIHIVDALTGDVGDAVMAGPDYSRYLLVDRDGDGVGDLAWYIGFDVLQEDLVPLSIDGGDEPDVHGGSRGDEIMSGGGGDDSLSGGGGKDWLFGGTGNDRLSGGSDDDLLVGNAGNDSITGGTGNDEISAGDGNDTASGNDGDDSLTGADGNDLLAGGGGADLLDGGSDDDHLNGGAGDDTLRGGAGQDYMLGGAGADRFVFGPRLPGAGIIERDHIGDFEPGRDLIDLTAMAGAAVTIRSVGGYVFVGVDAGRDGSIDLEIRVDSLAGMIGSSDILLA